MVGETGVEPAASWSRTKRATRLRYSPNWKLLHGARSKGHRVKTSLEYKICSELSSFLVLWDFMRPVC